MSCDIDCESSKIEYAGDGSQVDFTFPFEYIKQDHVHVALYNYTDEVYEDTDAWSFQNATTIRFDTAPPVPSDTDVEANNILIYRCTDLDNLIAEFYPGSAIRAQDLNANFEQLQFAIQEGQCLVPEWWTEENLGAIKSVISETQQQDGDAEDMLDEEHLFSSAASAARHDSYVQDTTPATLTYEQDGKIWNDTDSVRDYFWDSDNETWVNFTVTGPESGGTDETFWTRDFDTSTLEPATANDNISAGQGGTVGGESFIFENDGANITLEGNTPAEARTYTFPDEGGDRNVTMDPAAPGSTGTYLRQVTNAGVGSWVASQAYSGVDLSYTANGQGAGTVTNSGGSDATIPVATNTVSGLITGNEKQKLAGIESGAEVNTQANWTETNTESDSFIQNKPTIPAAQVQADWTETDTNSLAFILNKPGADVDTTYDLEVATNDDNNNVIRLTGSNNSTDDVEILGGDNVTVSSSSDDGSITIASTDSNTTYTLPLTQQTNDARVVLTSGDSSGDSTVNFVAGDNITLTVGGNPATNLTIDATNTNVTYTLPVSASGDDAVITLTGSDSNNDAVTFVQGNNINLTPSADDGQITIAAVLPAGLEDGDTTNNILHWAQDGSVLAATTPTTGATNSGNTWSGVPATNASGSGTGLTMNVIRRRTTGAHELYVSNPGQDWAVNDTFDLALPGSGTLSCTVTAVVDGDEADDWQARPGVDYFVSSKTNDTYTGVPQFMLGTVFGGQNDAAESSESSFYVYPVGDKNTCLTTYEAQSFTQLHSSTSGNANGSVYLFRIQDASDPDPSEWSDWCYEEITRNGDRAWYDKRVTGGSTTFNKMYEWSRNSNNYTSLRIYQNVDTGSYLEFTGHNSIRSQSANSALNFESGNQKFNFKKSDGSTGYSINAETGNAGFVLPADAANPANYDVDGEYSGPVQDRYAELEALITTLQQEKAALEIRLAALEANDIIDDATDNALLSLIASLSQRVTTLEGN